MQNFQIVLVDDETGMRDDADHPKPQTTRVVGRTSSEEIPPSLLTIASPNHLVMRHVEQIGADGGRANGSDRCRTAQHSVGKC
jgi:hypothetical protein